MNPIENMQQVLEQLQQSGNLRSLPSVVYDGRWVTNAEGVRMLNLASNDYLGLANELSLREEFLSEMTPAAFEPTSSSSRLLTGNKTAFVDLENQLAQMFQTEAALTFNSGYHVNTGLLPAVADANTVILADKLVHASLIDGIRLSAAKAVRYKHNDYAQLERLLRQYAPSASQVIIVTESVFSMDGDVADLPLLVQLKKQYDNVLLYVDEAHAFGVRGAQGLGYAEETGTMGDIDFLVGTFGKAAASAGAYWVGKRIIKDFLVNRMRTFIFTTALPPMCAQWTGFMLRHFPAFAERRQKLAELTSALSRGLEAKGYPALSQSHIVPLMVGDSKEAVRLAQCLQRKGFYVMPVRPPTVPEGTSRIRISLTADVTLSEVEAFLSNVPMASEVMKGGGR